MEWSTTQSPSYYYEKTDEEGPQPFAITIEAFVISMISGILSASSSSLIIYIIFRSQQKLSTTYHRIMALMSVFDIIFSTFVALGTIMMPSDNVFPFAGPMLGNKATCQAQGWLVTFGYTGATALNACLAWYFVCNITLKMDALKIRKRLEPVMYIYTLIIALFVPSFYLSKDFLNSHPYDQFCTSVLYQEKICNENGGDFSGACVSGDELEDQYKFLNLVIIVLVFHFVLIVLGMAVIIWSIYKNSSETTALKLEMEEDDNIDLSLDEHDEATEIRNIENHLENLKYSRVLIFQALMYIGAYIGTWILNFLSVEFNISSTTLDAANCALFPLQGLWNLLIFLYDKTYLIRGGDNRISLLQAVMMILNSETPEIFIADISHVMEQPNDEEHLQEEEKNEEGKQYDLRAQYDDVSRLRGNLSVESDISGFTGMVSDFKNKWSWMSAEESLPDVISSERDETNIS